MSDIVSIGTGGMRSAAAPMHREMREVVAEYRQFAAIRKALRQARKDGMWAGAILGAILLAVVEAAVALVAWAWWAR